MARSSPRLACLFLCVAAACGDSGTGGPPGAPVDGGGLPDVSMPDGATPTPDDADVDAASDAAADTGAPRDDGKGVDAARDDAKATDTTPPDVTIDTRVDTGTPTSGGTVLYPAGVAQSPITTAIAANLGRIASVVTTRNPHNFMKIGDPIMGDALGSPNQVIQGDFFGCVESAAPIKDLGTYTSLQTTIDYFRQGMVGGKTPFSHVSQCTRENLTSWDLLSENLMPAELTASNPLLAFVMFGSVDIGNGGTYTPAPKTDWVKYRDYGQAMLDIEDKLIEGGVIPVVFSMPPRLASDVPVVQTQVFVALTRAIAQGRQTPFIDFYSQLAALADRGLESDGLHITQYDVGGSARNCVFAGDGLKAGYNVMNLLGLQALERVRQVVVDKAGSLDATATTLQGAGTAASPFEMPALPFSDLRDLATATSRALQTYGSCSSTAESGGEFVYRLMVTQETRVRAVVIDKKGSPVAAHVYHLTDASNAASCVTSQSSSPSSGGIAAATLTAGSHYFVVDSASVASGKTAEYMLAVTECDPSDTTCK